MEGWRERRGGRERTREMGEKVGGRRVGEGGGRERRGEEGGGRRRQQEQQEHNRVMDVASPPPQPINKSFILLLHGINNLGGPR